MTSQEIANWDAKHAEEADWPVGKSSILSPSRYNECDLCKIGAQLTAASSFPGEGDL